MRKLLIALAVLAVLLVAADRGAEYYAERTIADRIDAELDQRPDVEIKGFSFLLQAVRGEYDEVTVSGSRASRDGVGIEDFRADLEGVRLPLSDVVEGDVQRVPTRVIQGSAVIPFADVVRVAGGSVPGLSITGDDNGRVRVTGRLSVLGQSIQATAVSQVDLSGGALRVRADSYEVDGEPAPAALRSAIGDLLDLRVPVPTLPYDLRIEDVSVVGNGLRLAASARGVVLTR